MIPSLEDVIFAQLLYNEEYARRVVPYLKKDYFSEQKDRLIFQAYEEFIGNYNQVPNTQALKIELSNLDGVDEKTHTAALETVDKLEYEPADIEWLTKTTEKWCQDRSIFLAIQRSIKILDGKDKEYDKGALPQILSDALAVNFDQNLGHNFFKDADERYASYHDAVTKIRFDLDYFNRVTCGGVEKGTLNVILAGVHVGKTLTLCHLATAYLLAGYDVLYITLEMAEKKIGQRIDANILDIDVDDLVKIPKDQYDKRMARAMGKTSGTLIIEQFPTGAVGAAHFRHLINDLKLKKKFKPQIVFIDQLINCASSRMKYSANINTNTYLTAVAEELRGLGIEYDIPIWSASQFNRSGMDSSDPSMTNTAESIGLTGVCDLIFALICDDNLRALNQIMVKQLKNRYGDIGLNTRFVVGVDRPKFRLYDAEENAQEDIVDDTPVMDKGQGFGVENKKFSKSSFAAFK